MHDDEIPIGKAEDLTDKQFGELTALYRIANMGKNTAWKCKCSCGTTTNVLASNLKKGNSKACRNCGNKKIGQKMIGNAQGKSKKSKFEGQKFGRLLVVQDSGKRTIGGRVLWECLCDCGNTCYISGASLQSGDTKSCGCFDKEQKHDRTFKDITNQRFGKLIALYPTTQNKQGQYIWYCKCDCGNEKEICGHDLRLGRVISCGCAVSKGQEKINLLLTQNNIKYSSEQTFKTCRFPDTNTLAKFDFYVNNQYIIEFDGEQHYKAKNFFGGEIGLQNIQKRDKFKNNWCKKNNIPLIRIPYTALEIFTIKDLIPETSQYLVKGE